jgi:hypothetical protein
MILHVIINLIHTINWNSLISFICGVVISALISYFFTKHRENQRLKIELQIKTTDAIINAIARFSACSAKLLSYKFTFLNFIIFNIISQAKFLPNQKKI